MRLEEVLNLHVIELNIGGATAYYLPKQYDGSWYTRDLGSAKRYNLARNARRIISEFSGEPWTSARVRRVGDCQP